MIMLSNGDTEVNDVLVEALLVVYYLQKIMWWNLGFKKAVVIFIYASLFTIEQRVVNRDMNGKNTKGQPTTKFWQQCFIILC